MRQEIIRKAMSAVNPLQTPLLPNPGHDNAQSTKETYPGRNTVSQPYVTGLPDYDSNRGRSGSRGSAGSGDTVLRNLEAQISTDQVKQKKSAEFSKVWTGVSIASGVLAGIPYTLQALYSTKKLGWSKPGSCIWRGTVLAASVGLNVITYYLITMMVKDALKKYAVFWKNAAKIENNGWRYMAYFGLFTATIAMSTALFIGASPLYTATAKALTSLGLTDSILTFTKYTMWIQRCVGLTVAWVDIAGKYQELKGKWNGQFKHPITKEITQKTGSAVWLMRAEVLLAVLPTFAYTFVQGPDLSDAAKMGAYDWISKSIPGTVTSWIIDNVNAVRIPEILSVFGTIGPFNLYWVNRGIAETVEMFRNFNNAYHDVPNRKLHRRAGIARLLGLGVAFASGAPAATLTPSKEPKPSSTNTGPTAAINDTSVFMNAFNNHTTPGNSSGIPDHFDKTSTDFGFEEGAGIRWMEWMIGSLFNMAAVCAFGPLEKIMYPELDPKFAHPTSANGDSQPDIFDIYSPPNPSDSVISTGPKPSLFNTALSMTASAGGTPTQNNRQTRVADMRKQSHGGTSSTVASIPPSVTPPT